VTSRFPTRTNLVAAVAFACATITHAQTTASAPLSVDPLLSENEVCSWLGFSLRTLQRKRKDGSIVGIPWSANRYRFRKSEIERFIATTEKETIVRFGGDKHESASSADLTKIPEQIAPNPTAALSREEPQAKQRRARGSRKTQVAQ
jgi:predicted DNA-binding transcriptional regulator AlpA